ncbi:MAG: DNA processing protein [Paracoccaceae bacterium]
MDIFSSPPPLAPPTSEEDRLSWLRLLRSRRVGPATFFRLMAEHSGSATQALGALQDVAANAGVKGYESCPEGIAHAELRNGFRAGAVPVFFGSPQYPKALMEIPDCPPVLWARGDITLLNRPAIALVGARNASSVGGRMARKLSGDLGAAGFVIVSGLARGIDKIVHEAALGTGTIAVVAGGVDVIYPRENKVLTGQIAEQGLIVSEHPPGLAPQARHFPKRNRIISGLAQAVVVVEAAARSGSLITARNALDQGRDVFAVPGHPFEARAAGGNMLIRDGALLVRGATDVIEAIAPTLSMAEPDVPRTLNAGQTDAPRPDVSKDGPQNGHTASSGDLPKRILDLLDTTPVAEDQLLRDLDISPADAAHDLLMLELDGAIERHAGGLIGRVPRS